LLLHSFALLVLLTCFASIGLVRAFNKTANDNSIRQFIATTLSQLRTLPPEPEMTQLDSGAEPQTVSPTMLDDADPKNQEIIKADPSKIVDCQPVAKSTQDATDFYQPEDTPKSIFQAFVAHTPSGFFCLFFLLYRSPIAF
jgi:hypothetical protein